MGAHCLFTTLSVEGMVRGSVVSVAPDIGGGSSSVGKKAGRSDVVTGVLRSCCAEPAVGAGPGLSAQSNPRAPTSANESRCGPTGGSASVPIPSGTTCSSAQGPSGITNSASVKSASRVACAKGTGGARPRAPLLSMGCRSPYSVAARAAPPIARRAAPPRLTSPPDAAHRPRRLAIATAPHSARAIPPSGHEASASAHLTYCL